MREKRDVIPAISIKERDENVRVKLSVKIIIRFAFVSSPLSLARNSGNSKMELRSLHHE